MSGSRVDNSANLVRCSCGIAPSGFSLIGSSAGALHRAGCPARETYDKDRNFRTARMALVGARWTPEQATELRQLIDAGAASGLVHP